MLHGGGALGISIEKSVDGAGHATSIKVLKEIQALAVTVQVCVFALGSSFGRSFRATWYTLRSLQNKLLQNRWSIVSYVLGSAVAT